MEQEVAPPGSRGSVLIVDDNDEARRMLEVRVEREGYRAVLAGDGQQALDLLGTHDGIDAVLLDLYMPGKSGFEVLQAVKADARLAHVPVVIISGGGDQEDLIRCIELGAVDYLPKPYNQALLRARLAACVTAKKKRDLEIVASLQATSIGEMERTLGNPSATAPPPVLRPTAPVRPPPERLGRIVVGREIGRGGNGVVYLGRHELLGMSVAVKLLRSDIADNDEIRARVLREARLAAHVSHPNVVRLLEIGETDDGIYLAYEYVDGGSLLDLLNASADRRLAIPQVVDIVRQVAEGLCEIDRQQMTHRDIKPANLLLSRKGEVKIADLGLLKRMPPDAANPRLTAENTILGTPLYLSPEQAEGYADLDIRSDLYSLGVVLYESLVGQPPFNKRSAMAILMAHLVSPPQPPSQLRPEIPHALEQICLKLLAKKRDDRFRTPQELIACLACV
jgi:CheY-like chemotaxis protein/predicted Ser/Thr protein kinase